MILDSNISDQTMSHSELSAFVTEIEGVKTIFQQGDTPIHRTVTTKKWFQDFGIETKHRKHRNKRNIK